jgi:hypothetical protein
MRVVSLWIATLGISAAGCSGLITAGGPSPGATAAPASSGPGGPSGGSTAACVTTASSPIVARRLTLWEYENSVADVLGVQMGAELEGLIVPDIRSNGFSNDVGGQLATVAHADAYNKAADAVGTALAKVPSWLTRFAGCNQTSAACRDEIARGLGLRLFRRPLSTDEVTSFGALFDAAVAAGSVAASDASVVVVRAMLQSPQFLYRLESQAAPAGGGSARPLDDYEIASRLSYFIWSSAPDDALLTAAQNGDLSAPSAMRAQVARMLKSPRARETIQRYFREWLSLDDLDDATRGPAFTPQLAADMKSETLNVVADQLWDAAQPLLSMFQTRNTIVTPQLAAYYGLPVPAADGRAALNGLPDRVGLLTHAGVLTINGDANASIVERGLFVLRNVLCQDVGLPPPGATSVMLAPPTASERQQSDVRLQHQPCMSCHSIFDPLAYAFEPFDSMGATIVRDTNGNAVRQDGWVTHPGAPNAPYNDVASYMDLLVKDQRVSDCMATKVSQFAWGRAMGDAELCMLQDVRARMSASKDKTFADMIVAVVGNPDFRYTTVQ